ncbi:hypothetical protein [Hymenobacter negativus]|uniref:Uncharacterized protein n=1 Tax=Hymenobacter negativus TaxID=2795026 RepID=A0ABS3QGA7_9BACT|nr:hypothetical protein [Hymenobacter negativus]MBO2010288.1 hypothetical protein [Hymenobacter negativus]
MKQLLPLLLLLGMAGSAQAQLVNLIATGVRVGTSAAVASRSSAGARNYVEKADPRGFGTDVNITPAIYRGLAYPQKRTPPGKLKTPGGEQIAAQEAELQKYQADMLADSTAAIGTTETWARLKAAQETIARERPTWNVQAYRDEAAFYQAEAARRQRVAATAPH